MIFVRRLNEICKYPLRKLFTCEQVLTARFSGQYVEWHEGYTVNN